MDEDQFPQVMGVAKAMEAVVAEVRFPEVVNGPSQEAGKDTDLIDRFVAAFAVDVVVGGLARSGRMQPPPLAVDP